MIKKLKADDPKAAAIVENPKSFMGK